MKFAFILCLLHSPNGSKVDEEMLYP